MNDTPASMLSAFDYVWDRLTSRMSGLTDDEYFWEPTPGCWSLRQGDDGRWALDGGGGGGPAPDPAPITTIAWRLCHLAGECVEGFTRARFAGPGEDKEVDTSLFPTTAPGVPPYLTQEFAGWRSALAALDEAGWTAELGPDFGPYSEATTLDLALHVLDEVVHHAGELGLMRDLYAHREALGRR